MYNGMLGMKRASQYTKFISKYIPIYCGATLLVCMTKNKTGSL